MVPSTASQKQLLLLRKSDFGNWVCLVTCSACLKMSLSWNLQCMFPLHCFLGDVKSLLNDNQLREMAQDRFRWRKLVVDCFGAERWWWRYHFLQYRKSSIKRQSGGLIYFTPILGGGLIETGGPFEREGTMVSVLHKELEYKVEKLRNKKVRGHAAEDQKQIWTSSW